MPDPQALDEVKAKFLAAIAEKSHKYGPCGTCLFWRNETAPPGQHGVGFCHGQPASSMPSRFPAVQADAWGCRVFSPKDAGKGKNA